MSRRWGQINVDCLRCAKANFESEGRIMSKLLANITCTVLGNKLAQLEGGLLGRNGRRDCDAVCARARAPEKCRLMGRNYVTSDTVC